MIDGFAKWIFATDSSDYHPNFQFNPQIKYNVGKHLSRSRGCTTLSITTGRTSTASCSAAIDSDQHAVSFLAKYHF